MECPSSHLLGTLTPWTEEAVDIQTARSGEVAWTEEAVDIQTARGGEIAWTGPGDCALSTEQAPVRGPTEVAPVGRRSTAPPQVDRVGGHRHSCCRAAQRVRRRIFCRHRAAGGVFLLHFCLFTLGNISIRPLCVCTQLSCTSRKIDYHAPPLIRLHREIKPATHSAANNAPLPVPRYCKYIVSGS